MSLKLTLTKRAGQIGPSINTRTEKHGEEDVPGIDIPVGGIFLDEAELCEVLQNAGAHEALFTLERGSAAEPRFQNLKAFGITDKFQGAKVTITVDDKDPLILKPAKVSKIHLEPQIGGLTAMSCTIQGNPGDHTDVLEMLNAKCRISIVGGQMVEREKDQPELDLEHDSQADSDEVPGPLDRPARKRKDRTRKDIDG